MGIRIIQQCRVKWQRFYKLFDPAVPSLLEEKSKSPAIPVLTTLIYEILTTQTVVMHYLFFLLKPVDSVYALGVVNKILLYSSYLCIMWLDKFYTLSLGQP